MHKLFYALFFCLVYLCTNDLYGQSYTLSGYLRDANSGEALVGGSIQVPAQRKGTHSNNYGFFSLTLPSGTYQLVCRYIGFLPDTQAIVLDRDISMDIQLEEIGTQLDAVEINAAQSAYAEEVQSAQMSQINLDVKALKLIPTLGGEADVIKAIQLLPGVTKGGEGTTSILVRGGDPDQNLILLDESVVYNVSHLFGFFSVFNPDALKDMTLIKGGFPAQYGGRLASVLDLQMQEGNLQSFHAKGGIGLLSSRLTVEGPIAKDKASFSISGRRTYIDRVLSLVNVPVPYYFYDLNAKANVKLGEKDRLFLSSYLGNDVLYTPDALRDSIPQDSAVQDSFAFGETDFGFQLGNVTTTLRWNHLFSARLFSNTSFILTRFQYDINGTVGENGIFIGSNVLDVGLKQDMAFYRNPQQTLRFGGQYIRHRFKPNVISAQGDVSQFVEANEVDPIISDEIALYVQQEWKASDALDLRIGLRATGAIVKEKVYTGLEPRLSVAYILNEQNSFKAGYSRMMQYMHLVSSSTLALPTDLWYPVTKDVKPQSAHQIAASYTHHFSEINSIFTIETYYKWMNNLTEYREGANLILNNNFEEQLLQGEGQAYGLEVLLKRDEGRLKGWAGYTLAYSQRQFDELNGGEPFWAKYDRRHDFSLVGILKLTDRLSLSAVYAYLSGSRFTPQVGQYFSPQPNLAGVELIPIYAARNSTRLTAATRLDINLILRNKIHKKLKSEWSFGCYNILNAPTPYRVNINYEPSRGLFYTQPSFLGRVLSIAWNFEL